MIRGLAKDWRRRPGRPRHTRLRTLEADLQPLNHHGLNSAWRHGQDQGRSLTDASDDDDDDIATVHTERKYASKTNEKRRLSIVSTGSKARKKYAVLVTSQSKTR